MPELVDHTLTGTLALDEKVRYELRPVKDSGGNLAPGLHSAWLILAHHPLPPSYLPFTLPLPYLLSSYTPIPL